MKRALLFLIMIYKLPLLNAQNVANASFDSVYLGGIDRLHSWITSDSFLFSINDTMQPMTPNTHFVSTTMQYHELLFTSQLEYSNTFDGPFAIKLLSINGKVKVDGSPFKGYVVNGNHFYTDSMGYIDFKKCGEPFPHRPSKLRGHYKFNNTSPALTNFGKAHVLLKKYNTSTQQIDTIGYAQGSVQFFPIGNWTAFELPITYFSSQIPDSLVLAFESSAFGLSSEFSLDSLGFYYPTPGAVNSIDAYAVAPYTYNASSKQLILAQEANLKALQVYDNNGRKLISLQSPTQVVSLVAIKQGIYFVNCISNTGVNKTYKLLVYDEE
ncbi:MAG TPA: T9SS type A sorting domain-containing protein [Bacteroidia bacterium]|nr:T9SS type A sorting domain-containing protein [Bacteroidia bacterium]HRH07384.1 T9SS type A sorting domain-containing protein [Bacteroidia bacterium]